MPTSRSTESSSEASESDIAYHAEPERKRPLLRPWRSLATNDSTD